MNDREVEDWDLLTEEEKIAVDTVINNYTEANKNQNSNNNCTL